MRISPKRIWRHLKRVLLTLGLCILAAVILGLVLTWAVKDNLLAHITFAVVAVFPILLALAAVLIITSHFLHRLYDIKTLREAYTLLSRLLFGPWAFGPYLLIKEGKIAKGAESVLHRVGGPGSLVIYHDSAVITERCGKLCRVLGTGFSSLKRFEKVWEIVDLRPQRWVLPVEGMTREGIPIVCEADISFKIDDRVPDKWGRLQKKQPTHNEPYPYTQEAVFRAATQRWIREPGSKKPTMDWAGRVMVGFAEGTLRNILAEYRLDWLIAPTESDTEHPREKIRRRLEEQLRQKAAEIGARILSVKLGEIRAAPAVDEQIPRKWIEAWQAEWESRALATQVEGEAELLRMDIAQAQAQAEMVITLTQTLQSVVTGETELQPYLLATRLVQALRWLSYDPFTRAFMPPEALQTLKRLQDAMQAERLLPSGQPGEEKRPAEGT
ncbi:MAG TPA: hypothetical protein ENI37_00300 [Chloroflexi bacterium]|nr:hypothetical protein [Chloroflexota bacterium]